MQPLLIRPATMADHAAIVTIAIPLHEAHAQAVPARFRSGVQPLPADYVRDILASPLSTILVSERDGEVTGFVILKLHDTPPIPILQSRRILLVDTLAGAPACQRQEIGRALMEAAVAWGRQHDAAEIELSVYAFNTGAIAFYESLGLSVSRLRMAAPIS